MIWHISTFFKEYLEKILFLKRRVFGHVTFENMSNCLINHVLNTFGFGFNKIVAFPN